VREGIVTRADLDAINEIMQSIYKRDATYVQLEADADKFLLVDIDAINVAANSMKLVSFDMRLKGASALLLPHIYLPVLVDL
jgi:hypothetical protein